MIAALWIAGYFATGFAIGTAILWARAGGHWTPLVDSDRDAIGVAGASVLTWPLILVMMLIEVLVSSGPSVILTYFINRKKAKR